jgi:vanillate O-demethylase monooxygenase subunit
MCPDSESTNVLQGVERSQFPRSSVPRRPAQEPRFLRNSWYVAMFSSDLDDGRLMHRTILNEPVLFYRKEDGGVTAIMDRCSHRLVPLSMGKLLPGDRVQCIYHGLEYGPDGGV